MISAAGLVGAQSLSEASRALQQAIDSDAAAALPELLDDFTKHYRVAMGQLQGYLQDHHSSGEVA